MGHIALSVSAGISMHTPRTRGRICRDVIYVGRANGDSFMTDVRELFAVLQCFECDGCVQIVEDAEIDVC